MHDGNKMTEVGLIPEDWNAYNLGDLIIGKPMYGANVAAVDFDIELPRYVRITDIKDDGRLHQTEIKSYPVSEELDYRLNVDDICFARSGATVGKTYLYDPCDGECIFAGYLIKFVPDRNKLIPKYLFHFTHSQHYYNWVKGNLRQGAQPNINAQEYSSLVLPLPPLSEQQKIADILTTVDDHISETESLIEKTKVLKQGLMQQLLTKGIGHTEFKDTEIGRIPVEWESTTIGNLSSIYRGASPRPINDSRWFADHSSIGWIRIADVTRSKKYLRETTQYLSNDGVEKSRLVERGKLIMSICGTIGRPIIIETPSCIHDGFIVFEDIDNRVLDTEFLYYWVLENEEYFRSQGQKGTQANINTDIVKSTFFAHPPIEEQRQIAAILTSVDDQIETYQAKLTSLTRLKTGLMQQLLTGKIRVTV